MPTPRDSTDDLSLQLEPITHTSCPPENVDRNEAWREETLSQIQHVFADAAGNSIPSRRVESNQVGDQGHAQVETCHNSESNDLIGQSPCDAGSSPLPIIASPQSSNEEENEPERSRTTGITSSALNLSYSVRYDIGSPRVCRLQ